MNAKPLMDQTGKQQAFYCAECRHIYGSALPAELCCQCSYCKLVIPYENVRRHAHDSCQEEWSEKHRKELFEKAEKVTGYDSYIYDPRGTGQDGYWQDMESLCDWLMDNFSEEDAATEWPEFVFCCKPSTFKISVEHIIDCELENHFEDAGDTLKGLPELSAAVDAFNKANSHIISFDPDYKRAVKVPTWAELRKEIEANK